MKNKIKKELLNEEIKKFKLMSEYAFYEDRDEKEELILGMNEEDEDTSEEAPEEESEELGLGDEDGTSEEAPEEEPEELGFGDEEVPEEESNEDEVELDVTELVKGSEEAKASADSANEKIDQLMNMVGNLEGQLKSMEEISDKIESLEGELEKRAPTPEEKIEMRSLDSYPYNLKLTDFWGDQEGKYDVLNKDEEGNKEKEYVLTKDDVDYDYNDIHVKTSLDDNDYVEDEI
tara:strand:- start:7692 stop:8390 length:699 start_codon:yes stop_codon:yes gene_type:complete